MRRLALLLLLPAAPAIAQTQFPTPLPGPPQALAPMPSPGQSPLISGDPRIQTVVYNANQVVRLRVASGFQLSVIFSPDERVENVAVGDSDAWQVTLNGRGDALFVKPLGVRGPTNMTVITDVRIYSFELSPAFAAGPDTPFTIRFQYPAARQPEPPAMMNIGRYRLGGNRSVRPAAVVDDGVRTTITWLEHQTLPAVFALDGQNHEILVDGAMRDGRYVIDTVYQTLIFRLDRQTARANRLPREDGR